VSEKQGKFMHKAVTILVLTSFFHVWAQNLTEERIWKIDSRKKSIYLNSGIFHHNQGPANSKIVSLRSSFVPGRGFERVVIDFAGNKPPKIYGHIAQKNKKIQIDFFDTSLPAAIDGLKNSKYVKNVDFLAIDETQTTSEINLKSEVNFDIFYLENPGRLVIDIRP
jgi:hypothetical protein